MTVGLMWEEFPENSLIIGLPLKILHWTRVHMFAYNRPKCLILLEGRKNMITFQTQVTKMMLEDVSILSTLGQIKI